MKLKKKFFLIFILLILMGGLVGFNLYNKIYTPNVTKQGFLYIPTDSNFNDVKKLVSPFLKKIKPFIWVANRKNYPNVIKPGKYQIKKGMTNNDLVNLLRSGKQTTVKLSFNNQDTFEKLAGRISSQIEADSISLLNAFTNLNFINNAGFDTNNCMAMYIPNSYEFYWNTSAEGFRKRMLAEYSKFWTTNRIQKAAKLKLSKTDVITLASIVQKETSNIPERPIVAGLYLNRLNDKWPLQADPTIIFALKQQLKSDVVIKRVLTKDLDINSPYNTYKHTGLPPGPISMPDISSIDAVLNAEKHNYYYMCASTTHFGKHKFAKTLSQHNRNARTYQNWINKQGINR